MATGVNLYIEFVRLRQIDFPIKDLTKKSKGEPDHLGLTQRRAFSLRRTYFVVIAMRTSWELVWALARSLSLSVAFGTV